MIIGKRVRLRKLERDDLTKFVDWFNDPDVRAGVSMFLPLSKVEEENWFEIMMERTPEEHALGIEVQEKNGWRMIGSCSLFNFDWRNRSAEYGIVIGDKAYWNQGYGTEVTQLILKHGFKTLNRNRISLRVFDTNIRARRAYEKAGYIHEGTLRQAEFKDGVYVDVHIMSVLRDDWQNNRLID